MKNNGARVVVLFRTLPGDSQSALVCGTTALPDAFHDSLMSLVESDSGQQANELADILSVRRFPDGSNMLEFLHRNGLLTKVPTTGVVMMFDAKNQIPLNELNQLIADQKGVSIDELAISEDNSDQVKVKEETIPAKNKWDKAREEKATTEAKPETVALTPAEMRSRADALYKEAARLRKEADAMDPPKKKAKAEVEA